MVSSGLDQTPFLLKGHQGNHLAPNILSKYYLSVLSVFVIQVFGVGFSVSFSCVNQIVSNKSSKGFVICIGRAEQYSYCSSKIANI